MAIKGRPSCLLKRMNKIQFSVTSIWSMLGRRINRHWSRKKTHWAIRRGLKCWRITSNSTSMTETTKRSHLQKTPWQIIIKSRWCIWKSAQSHNNNLSCRQTSTPIAITQRCYSAILTRPSPTCHRKSVSVHWRRTLIIRTSSSICCRLRGSCN